MKKGETILRDVSLCAIVRDEKNNPAGGIKRFVDSHVPYVDEAVIVDTGSIDGTREILDELCSLHPNLRVYDHKFDGYANSRNFSLKNVKTQFALILDADELLTHKKPQDDFRRLKDFMDRYPSKVYSFDFIHYSPKGEEYASAHDRRLFQISETAMFNGSCWEILSYPFFPERIAGVQIKHFLPSSFARDLKRAEWYNKTFSKLDSTPPSKAEGFQQWKEFNPFRNKFK